MPRLLSVSRAARLVGTSRAELQRRIRNGDLPSFEGQVRLSDLTRLYPDAHVEDTAMLERVERIIEQALHKARRGQTAVPDMEILAARVSSLSDELASAKLEVSNLNILVEKLKSRLHCLQDDAEPAVAAVGRDLSAWLEQELRNMPTLEPQAEQLLAHDTFLRIVAAHVHLLPSGHDFFVQGTDTILEAGLSAGLALDYGCSNGNCGKCKARLLSGEIKQVRPSDYVFSESEKALDFFLMCCHTAVSDITVEAREAGSENEIPVQEITARLRKVEFPSPDVAVMSVRTPRTQRLRFLAGQSVDVAPEGLPPRRLPIASCPCDDMNLQFHVPRRAGDALSDFVFGRPEPGVPVHLQGPHGHFVLHDAPRRPLIFIAWDTGFAPVHSLIEHALSLDTGQPLHLYWVAGSAGGHYQDNVCRAWADAIDGFAYTPLPVPARGDAVAELARRLAQGTPRPAESDVFVAAPHEHLARLRETLAAAGADPDHLFTEAV